MGTKRILAIWKPWRDKRRETAAASDLHRHTKEMYQNEDPEEIIYHVYAEYSRQSGRCRRFVAKALGKRKDAAANVMNIISPDLCRCSGNHVYIKHGVLTRGFFNAESPWQFYSEITPDRKAALKRCFQAMQVNQMQKMFPDKKQAKLSSG